MRPLWDGLRRKVKRATRQLPSGMIGPLVNDEFGDVFSTLIAVTGEDDTCAQMKVAVSQSTETNPLSKGVRLAPSQHVCGCLEPVLSPIFKPVGTWRA